MQDISFVIRIKLFIISSFHVLHLNMCGVVFLIQLVPRLDPRIFPDSSSGFHVMYQLVETLKSMVWLPFAGPFGSCVTELVLKENSLIPRVN
jgi:hypothetical protein